jgi:hypothetical protein
MESFMQVVPIESRTLTSLNNQIRDGVIRAYRILEGEPGAENYSLQLVNIEGDFFSPRHRHNFDQIRIQLEGQFDYDKDGCFAPGSVGYFPEGTRYGPQTSSGVTWNLLLQFGGASGSGFTAESEGERAAGELKGRGAFEKGVFTRYKEDGTKVNQDAYEAIWEHIHGRPLVYPKERYERPVFMNSGHFDWVPVSGQPGVRSKPMGVFSELETKIAFFKLAAGSVLPLEDQSFYFVLSGTGETAGQAVSRHATVQLGRGEPSALSAKTELECVQIRLPRQRDVASPQGLSKAPALSLRT